MLLGALCVFGAGLLLWTAWAQPGPAPPAKVAVFCLALTLGGLLLVDFEVGNLAVTIVVAQVLVVPILADLGAAPALAITFVAILVSSRLLGETRKGELTFQALLVAVPVGAAAALLHVVAPPPVPLDRWPLLLAAFAAGAVLNGLLAVAYLDSCRQPGDPRPLRLLPVGLLAQGACGLVGFGLWVQLRTLPASVVGTAVAVLAAWSATRRIERARRASMRIEALRDAGTRLASALSLPEVLTALVGAVSGLLDVRTAEVIVTTEAGHALGAAHPGSGVNVVLGPSEIWDRLRAGGPVLVRDTDDDPGLSPDLDRRGEIECVAVPLTSAGGAVIGGILAFTKNAFGGVTEDDAETLRAFAPQAVAAVERARIHHRQVEAEASLREEDQLRWDFVANCGHELRTPLTTISGFAETLVRRWADLADDVRLDLAGRISKASRGYRDVVENLLRLNETRDEQTQVPSVDVDLEQLARDVVSSLAVQNEDHCFELDVVPPVLGVRTSPASAESVLRILCDNAAKFSPPGTPVVVRLRFDVDEAVVEVADKGPGLPEEIRRDPGRPFRQGDASSTRTHGGLGIGLALGFRLADRMGAAIRVVRTGPGGTTMALTVPRVNAADVALTEAAATTWSGRDAAGG